MLTLRLVIYQAHLRCTTSSKSETYIKSYTLPCQQDSITWTQHDFLEKLPSNDVRLAKIHLWVWVCCRTPLHICDMADKVPNGPGKVECGSGVTPGQAHLDLPNNLCKKHWKDLPSEKSAKQERQPKDPRF